MSNNRSLVVIGGYPNTKRKADVLKDCILSLKDHFDILLCTHYPADIELQKLVNYYIYDDRNDFFENETVYMWAAHKNIYFEYYYGENGWKHHSYAIYRNLLNSVSFLNGHYEDFYYVDGDSIFHEKDIKKLKEIPNIVDRENKNAFFFYTENHIQTIFFYFKTKFFVSTFPNCKNVNEYRSVADSIESFGVLENFFYRVLKTTNSIDKVFLAEETKDGIDYFADSKMNINRFSEDLKNEIPFEVKLVKVKDSNDLAYVCINGADTNIEQLDLYIDGEYIDTVPGLDPYKAKKVYPKNEVFNLKLGDSYTKTYKKSDILKSKTFVQFT